MHKKLISVDFSVFLRMRSAIGTPDMKATSLRDLLARTPTCHSFLHPGAFSALKALANSIEDADGDQHIPIQEGDRVVESEHGFIILDIMPVQKLPYFFKLVIC